MPRRCGGMEDAHAAARRALAVKPVGKPDAGNPHVRFDERGGETGRASDTAPFLDSTAPLCGLWCVPEGRDHLVGASPTRAMVGWPGSWQAVRSGNWPYRSPATNPALGRGANRRAVTCVKPEQASKGKLWTPTRPEFGEGSTGREAADR